MANASVVNGYLIPAAEDVRAVMLQLQQEMQTNAQLAMQYQMNPRLVLGLRGLSLDVQDEVMGEGDIQAGCAATCACTGCCVTN